MTAAALPARTGTATGWPMAGTAAVIAPLLGFAATPLLGEYGLQIGFRLFVFMALAEAWNLLAGYAGLVSLGSAAFVGTGAYVLIGLMNKAGLPLAPAIALCGASAAGLAVLVSPAVFRMRGLYFTVGTLALSEALRLLMVNLPSFGGASGLFLDGDPLPSMELYLAACGLFLLAAVTMTAATQTRLSVILRAVRDDEDAAAQFGVRPFRVKLAAFTAASALMGMAGGLQGYKLATVEPYGMFGLTWSTDTLSIVIIGGIGLHLGPIVGTVFVIAFGELLADYPELHVAITGVILIVLIRFAPRGFCGLAAGLAARRRPVQAERA